MYSKSAVAAILLTSVAGVLGAPAPAESQQSSQTATVSPPAATPELSLTARLTLADTAADRYALLPDDKQFVFDFNQEQKGAGKGGQLVAANRKTFPALVGTGAGMAVGRVGPCGINTFHVHPRGAELQIVVKGSLVTEMTPENGVNNADGTRRVIKTTLKPFQMTPFPQGSVHVQFNDNCDETVFVAAFPSEDFGTGQVADELFAAADDDLVAAVLGQSIDGAQVDKIRKAIPKSIAQGVDSCLKKCNIPKRSL